MNGVDRAGSDHRKGGQAVGWYLDGPRIRPMSAFVPTATIRSPRTAKASCSVGAARPLLTRPLVRIRSPGGSVGADPHATATTDATSTLIGQETSHKRWRI